jgi:hypothetical protein
VATTNEPGVDVETKMSTHLEHVVLRGGVEVDRMHEEEVRVPPAKTHENHDC